MTTRTLITHALWAATLSLPAALATAQPQPAPRPAPIPAPAPQPQQHQQQAPDIQPLTLGEPVINGLNRDDYTTPDGQTWDIYHVELTAGETYHFSAVGLGYSASVQILTADGDPLEGTKTSFDDNSVTIYTIETATYSIVVGTNDEGTSGRYILRSGTGERPAPVTSIDVPETTRPFTGELNDQSEKSEQGRFYEYSVVDLEAGTIYCLYLESPDDGVFANVASGDGSEVEFLAIEQEGAYIRFTPTVSGPHALIQTAKQPNHATSFTGYAWVYNTGSRNTIMDQLSAQSTRLDDGTYFGFHEIELNAGTTYRIDVESDDFDTIAYLFDADNNQLATNDNCEATGTNAQITFTPETTGTYSVGVGSTQPGATGWYTATIASGDRIGEGSGVSITRDGEDSDAMDTDESFQDGPRNADAHPIVGRWEAVMVEINGETSEIPAGMMYMVYNADGTGQVIQHGNAPIDGLYRVEGNRLTTLDPDGTNPDHTTFQLNGDTLILTGEFEPGTEMTITFRRTTGEAPDPGQANTPTVVGRWDMATITDQGQTHNIPAGTVTLTLYADGTVRAEGQELTDTGVYSIEGDQLTLRYESDGISNLHTVSIENGVMTFVHTTADGKTGTVTFNYLGEPERL